MVEQFLDDRPSAANRTVGSKPGGAPTVVRSLKQLAKGGYTFQTVMADPPWRYTNTASRAAAEKRYGTLSVEETCKHPVSELIGANAHQHLWTNEFLETAFKVVRARGLEFTSCMVWVKPSVGMGNYWRASHEFLLFGVRGKLKQSTPTAASLIPSVDPRKYRSFTQPIPLVDPRKYRSLTQAIPSVDPRNTVG